MADAPVTPPNPPVTPPPAPTTSLWQKLKGQVTDLWDKDKGIFLIIAIVAAIVKFRDLFLDFLINSAKNVDKNAQAKDSVLADQETQLKQQADAAVQQAQQDAPKDGPVNDDWYKKN